MQPDSTIARKSETVRGAKKNKTQVTVFVTVNSDGSDKRRAWLINKSKTLVAFRKAKINPENLPIVYKSNKKAWMLSGIWYEFLGKLNEDMKAQGRHIALITDNAPTHPPPEKPPIEYTGPKPPVLDHITLFYLPPNTTAWLQPLDAGIIRSLKAGYRCRYVTHIVDFFERTGTAAPKLDVLQVIYMIAAAWDELPTSVIFHCWQKVGLVEAIDRGLHGSYSEYMEKIRQATQISMGSLLDFGCNSQQVERLANSFLDYDEDAPDIDANPDSISMTDIILDLQNRGHGCCSDSDSSSDHFPGNHLPEPISISLAKAHISSIVSLLERFPTNTLPVSGSLLQIPTAIHQLQKIHQGFQEHEVKNKKQVDLNNWLQLGSLRPEGTTISPELIPGPSSTSAFTPTPEPPSQLLRFSPIASALIPDLPHDGLQSLHGPQSQGSQSRAELGGNILPGWMPDNE